MKKLSAEVDKLNAQLAKISKEVEAKANLNSRYSEIQT